MPKGWLVLATLSLFTASPAAATANGTWRFQVFLDGRAVGWHEFRLEDTGEIRRLTSHAELDVRILTIRVYTYRHTAVEDWRGDCLERLESTTDDNGTRLRVQGSRTAAGFTVEGAPPVELPTCVMTFAYWNPDFLRAVQLLNPQTGRYVRVHATPAEDETIAVRGAPQHVRAYRLFAEGGEIDLWYAPDGQWVGLASSPDGKRRLEYRLQ